MKDKQTFKKSIAYIVVFFIFLSYIMPFNHIYADSSSYNGDGTYIGLTNGCQVYLQQVSTGNYWYTNINSNSDIRGVVIKFGTGRYYTFLISLSSFTFTSSSVGDCGNSVQSSASKTYNGETFYANFIYDSPTNSTNFIYEYPLIEYGSNPSTMDGKYQVAYRYTFGDLSEDPTPPSPPITPPIVTYNYYTDFASNQQNTANSLKSNRDTISWNYDPTKSNINGLDIRIELRAVPSKYYASTESALDSLTWGDLTIESSYIADLGSYHWNYNGSKASFTWEEVIDKFLYYSNLPQWYNDTFNYWNFKKKLYSDYWYWCGWVYQARINTVSGDYTGEWETIYQVSAAPPESASTVINYYVTSSGVTEPIYQTIQNINNQNNITNNQWYVNGSPFNVDDNTTTNWWEQLLQFIRDIVSEILGFLGGIFDSVINGVLELVNGLGINFLEVFTNLINNIVDLFGNIDLTGNGYTIPEEYTNNINTFNTWTTGIFNVLISSGLGLFVFIPMIMLVVRLFL